MCVCGAEGGKFSFTCVVIFHHQRAVRGLRWPFTQELSHLFVLFRAERNYLLFTPVTVVKESFVHLFFYEGFIKSVFNFYLSTFMGKFHFTPFLTGISD